MIDGRASVNLAGFSKPAVPPLHSVKPHGQSARRVSCGRYASTTIWVRAVTLRATF